MTDCSEARKLGSCSGSDTVTEGIPFGLSASFSYQSKKLEVPRLAGCPVWHKHLMGVVSISLTSR